MLRLPVDLQRPCRQVCTPVRTLKPYPLLVTVGESLPCHPLLVSCFQLGPHHEAGAAEHPDRLPDVFSEPHPVKQTGEGVNCSLKLDWVRQCDQAVIFIEKGGKM